jgi:acyl-CoA synthetase (AMP-forming)/AMP-acid ligase II
MIVTEQGKNIYPEDIEAAFEQVPCQELVIYAADYLWPRGSMQHEQLVAVVRAEPQGPWQNALREANRTLPEFKRIHGVVLWPDPFPRTASLKLKRGVLADALRSLSRSAIIPLDTL